MTRPEYEYKNGRVLTFNHHFLCRNDVTEKRLINNLFIRWYTHKGYKLIKFWLLQFSQIKFQLDMPFQFYAFHIHYVQLPTCIVNHNNLIWSGTNWNVKRIQCRKFICEECITYSTLDLNVLTIFMGSVLVLVLRSAS